MTDGGRRPYVNGSHVVEYHDEECEECEECEQLGKVKPDGGWWPVWLR